MAEALYQKTGAASANGAPGAEGAAPGSNGTAGAPADDVIDAEFKEAK
jgi:molecular chaperone DnaK